MQVFALFIVLIIIGESKVCPPENMHNLTKLPQRSDGSTISINHTSLFPPLKIYIYLAAHNALVCNPPASIYYTEIFPKGVNFNLMGGNFFTCTVNFINDYVLKSICVLFLFFQLLGFRVFYNFQRDGS